METENRDINIALLIDADNIAARYTESILSELSRYGKITVRRMYGDWSQSRLRRWLSVASRYSLTPVMQPNNTPGKNASDIGLIIDAMDLLYTGEVEGFCIVSSDGDFKNLATRIRESGKIVIGMGEKKTPESFRASCERFVFLDVLKNALDDDDPAVRPDDAYEEGLVPLSDSDHTEPVTKQALENAIINMITDNAATGKETGLGEIGSRLEKIYPDFDIRNYNYSKLSAFLKDFDSLSVTTRNKAAWVSLKGSSVKDVEAQIADIFAKNKVSVMNIGRLKDELQKVNPALNATIKLSGVTKFSVFLEKKISCVRIKDKNEVEYIKKSRRSSISGKRT